MPRRPEIRVNAPGIAHGLKPLFRAAYPGKEYTEIGLARRVGRINLIGALHMAQRRIEATSFQVQMAQRRVARAFTIREFDLSLRQCERAIKDFRRPCERPAKLALQDHRQ